MPSLPATALDTLAAVHTPGVDGAALDAAVSAERARTAGVIADLLVRPDVAEALYVASSDALEAVGRWREVSDRPDTRGVPATAWRYLARMSRRATPFGLFAGCVTGGIGDRTALSISADTRRHTRVDISWLTQLVDEVEPQLRDALDHRVNDTLYRTADALRYAETRVDPVTGARRNDHVALEPTPAIEAVLAAAPERPGALAEAVRRLDPRVSPEEARAFVDALIDARLFVPALSVPVTGPDPIVGLVRQLAACPPAAGLARSLAGIHALLRALDTGVAHPECLPRPTYAAVVDALRALRPDTDPRRLFHVDLYRSGEVTLGPTVLRAVADARDVLLRITPHAPDPVLGRLAERFVERWGGGARPLAEVLDGERGIGFGDDAPPSPLLLGLPMGRVTPSEARFGARERWMARRVAAAGPGGEWVLDERDLEALKVPEGPPLPDAHVFVGTILAKSAEAIDRGDFRLRAEMFGGPSGARLFGRFCHGDPVLRAAVEAHLRAEEACRPDAVFAEIVHLPEGRDGNVLARPVLRAHEIRYLGHGEGPVALPLEDLLLSVTGRPDRPFVLRSARLGREVIPRLTSAHNHSRTDLPIYRFLGALQGQGVDGTLMWRWGALDGMPFLPRVRWRNIVLSPATWLLGKQELAPVLSARDAQRLREARSLRERRGLPRHVALVQADNILPLDLESPVALDALAAVARDLDAVGFEEVPSGDWPVMGPEGPHTHEVVIPFVRSSSSTPLPSPPPEDGGRGRVRSPPGSEWLYVCVYCGSVTADAVLREVVAPIVRNARSEGIDRWFFVRYADPEHHLRIRMHGPPERMLGVYAALHAALAAWLADSRVWRVTLDTYQPEVDRYGGVAGITLAEAVFSADSDAVLALLATLEGDAGEESRWRLALVGTHTLLDDLGVPEPERIRLLRAWRDAWMRKLRVPDTLPAALDARYRAERPSIAPLLDAPEPAFVARSAALAPLVAELHARGLPVAELAESYVHMALNRLFRGDPNAHELVVYDFLSRLYVSRTARR